MFIPLAVVIPLYLLTVGYLSKDQRVLRGGIVSLLITVLLLGGLLIFQTSYTGAATYVNQTGKGFYPDNLLAFYPVVIAAYVNIPFIYSASENIGLRYGQFNGVIWLLNILLLSGLIFLFVKLLIRKKFMSLSLTQHFIYIGSIVSLLIIGLLATLSLRYAPLLRPDYSWTFVQESRYMAFIVIVLQLLAFVLIFKNWSSIKNKLVKIAGFIIIMSLTIELIHGMYFTSKLLLVDKAHFHPDKNYIQQKEYIKELMQQYSNDNHDLVFTSGEKTFLNIAGLYGAKILYNFDPSKKLGSSKPFVLLIIVKNGYLAAYASLLKGDSARPIKTIGNLSFYEYRPE
jgi:hypothetical protein